MHTQRTGTPRGPTADGYVAACIYAATALTLVSVGVSVAVAWASALERRRHAHELRGDVQVYAEICTLERWLSER